MLKKNVLIISPYYPPVQSIASNRIFSFAKYLSKEKFNIFVITTESEGSDEQYEIDGVKVFRIKNKLIFKKAKFTRPTNFVWHIIKVIWNIFLRFVIEDELVSWTKQAINLSKDIIKKNGIDLIISSYAPLASHKVALKLKNNYINIKWIADMRDEMSLNPYLTKREQKKLRQYEKQIFNNADAITAVSQPICEQFRNIEKSNRIYNFIEIRNGYDFEFTSDVTSKNDIFTITYCGSFYHDIKPDSFFRALEELISENKIITQVSIFGATKPLKIPLILKNHVVVNGKIPHYESILKLKKADLLLLIIPNNSRKGVYTGKIFDYLGVLKPILGLVPLKDVAAKLLNEANVGYIAENENNIEIKEQILKAYNDWKNNKPFIPNIEFIKSQHRKEQVKELEKLIGDLLDG